MKKKKQNELFIRGKFIFLKALSRQDVLDSNWFRWFNDEKTCETLQQHYFPNTLETQLKYFDDLQEEHVKGTKIQLGICKINTSKLVGIISLKNIDYINKKAEISAVIGEKEGKDIQTISEAWKLIFWHGFNALNLNRIYGGTMSKSILDLMCRLVACKKEGIRRKDVYKNGEYLDVYEYGVLKKEFNAKYKDILK